SGLESLSIAGSTNCHGWSLRPHLSSYIPVVLDCAPACRAGLCHHRSLLPAPSPDWLHRLLLVAAPIQDFPVIIGQRFCVLGFVRMVLDCRPFRVQCDTAGGLSSIGYSGRKSTCPRSCWLDLDFRKWNCHWSGFPFRTCRALALHADALWACF